MNEPLKVEAAAAGPASPFATVPEAAEFMRCSEVTIRRAINRHELEAIKFGRQLRIPKTALEALATGGKEA